jgi:hypothetical protein
MLAKAIKQETTLTSWRLLSEDFADQFLDLFGLRLVQTLHPAQRWLLPIAQEASGHSANFLDVGLSTEHETGISALEGTDHFLTAASLDELSIQFSAPVELRQGHLCV